MKYANLIKSLQTADTDDKTFKNMVDRAIKELDLVDKDLAIKVGVARTTVLRWRNGNASPWPPMRTTVYRALVALAQEKA